MSLHLLFRNGSDLVSIYKHKVSLAPKKFLLLPPFDLPIFRLMIRFALCSRLFHSHGGGHSHNMWDPAVTSFQDPYSGNAPPLVGSLSNTKHPCCFFLGFLPKIRPEKCDFDQYEVFFMGKMVQIFQILENKKFKLPDFYSKFQQVAKNIEGSWFFSTFISGVQPELAKLVSGCSPPWLHHKILKRNPANYYMDHDLVAERGLLHLPK